MGELDDREKGHHCHDNPQQLRPPQLGLHRTGQSLRNNGPGKDSQALVVAAELLTTCGM